MSTGRETIAEDYYWEHSTGTEVSELKISWETAEPALVIVRNVSAISAASIDSYDALLKRWNVVPEAAPALVLPRANRPASLRMEDLPLCGASTVYSPGSWLAYCFDLGVPTCIIVMSRMGSSQP